MNKIFILAVIGLMVISFNLFYLDHKNDDFVSARSPPNNISKHSCGYQDVTPIFKRHGMPYNSNITEIEKISPHYLSLLVSNRVINRTELYLYNLGNDLMLDTQDDFAFLLGPVSNPGISNPVNYISPVIVLTNGSMANYTVYWVDHLLSRKEVKSCEITNGGCINTITRAFLPLGNLRAMIPSVSQDKIYFAHTHKNVSTVPQRDFSIFRSCSIQMGTQDYCNSNFSNFTVHNYSNTVGTSYYYRKSLNLVGFAVIPNYPVNYTVQYPDNQTYLFNINLPNPNVIIMPPLLDVGSLISFGTSGVLLGIRNDIYNGANDSISLVDIQSNSAFDLGYLDHSIEDSHLVDLSNSLVAVYGNSSIIFGKALGSPEITVYSYTAGAPQVVPKVILNDRSIIGFVPSQRKIVKFNCKP